MKGEEKQKKWPHYEEGLASAPMSLSAEELLWDEITEFGERADERIRALDWLCADPLRVGCGSCIEWRGGAACPRGPGAPTETALRIET